MKQVQICETLGRCAARLATLLMEDYVEKPRNPDVMIWENFGFLLADLYNHKVITHSQVCEYISCFSTAFTFNRQPDVKIYQSIAMSAQFYSQALADIFITQAHTSPDVVVYNLLRPQSWKGFEDMDLFSVDIFEIISVWPKILSFMEDEALPKLAAVLRQ